MLEGSEQNITDERTRKYRLMKRKLVDFIKVHREAQDALDKANRRIKFLENKTKELMKDQQQQQQQPEAMDISEDEDQENKHTSKRVRTVAPTAEDVELNDDGSAKMPIKLGGLEVLSLGTIQHDKKGFHSDRYIFPLGYESRRTYMSTLNPDEQTVYTCKIEQGPNGPKFTVVGDDTPDTIVEGKSATNVWTTVIRKVNDKRDRMTRNAISGPEYYGLSHPVVRAQIERMENADKCANYKKKR
ncbi:F/Y rich C-terminus-domain-containing protein [Gongronella butleri]|nr:F/Y rich C-terminus-domain-containing protein [Gongronella butleri]